MKKAVVTVTNDLSSDQRVQRSITVLQELGYSPTFVGRKLPDSSKPELTCHWKRFKLWFHRGFLFYANYNLRLFFYLLTHRFDFYLANDLDTLLPCFLIARMRSKTLVYDTHEYFTGVPEIQNRPVVKAVWTALERSLFPRLQTVITVNESIAHLYHRDYGIKPMVVRNISNDYLPQRVKSRAELGLPEDKFILINQGSGINADRGMEELLDAMLEAESDIILLLVGGGDVIAGLRKRAEKEQELRGRVHFVSRLPYREMLHYTLNADCGVSLDKPTNINYRYSLPNKIFDYIKCGIPLLCSDLVEPRRMVEHYRCGEIVADHQATTIGAGISRIRGNGKAYYAEGLKRAYAENNWQRERQKLRWVLAQRD